MPSKLQESVIREATEFHRRYPVILIHDHEPLTEDLPKCRASGVSGKVLLPVLDVVIGKDLFVTGPVLDGWADHARTELRKTISQISDTGGQAFLATSTSDFRRAHRDGTLAVLLGSEGGKLIEGSLDLLREFYDMGYRCMQLVWNFPNQIARATEPDEGPGLTAFGGELIRELNRLGIIIDLAHAGRQTFLQVIEASQRPVMLSHGGARGAIERSRHPQWHLGRYGQFIDDEMLRLLARNGGLLGINFFGPLFFEDAHGNSDITIDDVLDHFQYVADTVGVDVLGLGCDYFPTHGAWAQILPRGDTPRDYFVLPKDQLPRFTARLLARGWREEDIAKVLGGNFLRFCDRVFEGKM